MTGGGNATPVLNYQQQMKSHMTAKKSELGPPERKAGLSLLTDLSAMQSAKQIAISNQDSLIALKNSQATSSFAGSPSIIFNYSSTPNLQPKLSSSRRPFEIDRIRNNIRTSFLVNKANLSKNMLNLKERQSAASSQVFAPVVRARETTSLIED